MARDRRFGDRPLPAFMLGPPAASLLASALLAIIIGAADTIRPVTITAQFIGLLLLIAGLIAAAGLAALVRLRSSILSWPPRSWARKLRWLSPRPSWTIIVAWGGALTGVYIDLTVVLYSYRYRPAETAVFSLAALLCAVLAVIEVPAVRLVWPDISTTVKSLGAIGAVLALVVQFWYQQAYLPENTQVGIRYSVTVGAVTADGTHYSLIPVTLTMENESSVTALTLSSMIAVQAVVYTASGQEKLSLLGVRHPVEDDSYLFPSSPYTKSYVVVAPKQDQALQISVQVDYARVPRLVLGSAFRPDRPLSGCPAGEVVSGAWQIRQSALRAFTTGDLALYSYRCASPSGPFIAQYVEPRGATEPRGAEAALQAHFGTAHSSRQGLFLIPATHG